MTFFCNHYRAMSDHDTCNAGVAYDTFKGMSFEKRPCFGKVGRAHNGGCELQQMPTAEELATEKAEMNRRFAMLATARAAIVKSLGGPWTRGMAAATGRIDCPCCNSKDSLRFSRAGYNGHIHASCSTEGCVRWVE